MKAFPTEGFEPKVIDIPDSIGVSNGKKVVAPCSGTKITPYIKVDDGGWSETLDLKVAKGATVQFGPHPWDGKVWEWVGPDGFSSTTRENTLTNVDGSKSGYYTVTYTNETSCKTYAKIKLVVDDPDKPFVDTLTTAVSARHSDIHGKPSRILYYDMLGNQLKGAPQSGIYLRKSIFGAGKAKIDVIRNRK
jgi:hypothetical protein